MRVKLKPILTSAFFSYSNTYSCLTIQFHGHSSCLCIWLRVMYSSSSKMRSSSSFSSRNHIPFVMNFKLRSCSSWLMYLCFIVCSVPIIHAILFMIDEIQLIVTYATIQITLMNPWCWFAIPSASVKCQVSYNILPWFKVLCSNLLVTPPYVMIVVMSKYFLLMEDHSMLVLDKAISVK